MYFSKVHSQEWKCFLSTWNSFYLNGWCYIVSDDTTNYKKIGRTNLLLWENWTLRTHFNFSSDMCITKVILAKYIKHLPYFLAYTLCSDCSKTLNHVVFFTIHVWWKYFLNWIALLCCLRFYISLGKHANLLEARPFLSAQMAVLKHLISDVYNTWDA